jgi:hypothetical protein
MRGEMKVSWGYEKMEPLIGSAAPSMLANNIAVSSIQT